MSLNIIDTLNPLGSFPVAKAADISVGSKRLDVALAEKVNAEPGKSLISQGEKTQIADSSNSTKNLAIPSAINEKSAGITLSRDEQYRVIVSGEAVATVRYIVSQVELAAGAYIVSGCTDGSGSTYRLRIGAGAGNEFLDSVTTAEKTITLASATLITVEVNVFTGTELSSKVFPVMIRKATISDPAYVAPAFSPSEITRQMLLTMPDAPLRVLCVGDSIAYGARNGLKGFVGGLGFPYQIDGLPGATLSTKQTGVKNIPQQLIDSDYQNPDIVISDGGINDYLQSAQLGNIPTAPITTDEQDAALNLETVTGGVQHLFYNMIKKYPDAQRFFVLTHKTTASLNNYEFGENIAEVTTPSRRDKGIDFINNNDNTFSIFRNSAASAAETAAFTLSDVTLDAGTYIFGGLIGGRWTTGTDEYLLLRFTNKSTGTTLVDITNKPQVVTLDAQTTVTSSIFVGKLFEGTYTTVAPSINECSGSNLATVTTETRSNKGVVFTNNGDNTFTIERPESSEEPQKVGFTLSDITLPAGSYVIDGLSDGYWATNTNEQLMLRYINKSTGVSLADITDSPKMITLAEQTTITGTIFVGAQYSGESKTIAPFIEAYSTENEATVTTASRTAKGVEFINNGDNTFSFYRDAATSGPVRTAFTVAEIELPEGIYYFDGLNNGRWQTGVDEYLLLRYSNKDTGTLIADITTKPKTVHLPQTTTVRITFFIGKLYEGACKTVMPIIKEGSYITEECDFTTTPNKVLVTQTEIFDAIRKISDLYGVKIIDVFNDSMLNTAFAPYVSPTPWDDDHSITETEYCDADGIHPLNKGYEAAYLPLIKRALQLGTEK